MNIFEFQKIVKKRRLALAASVGIFLLVALVISFSQPLKYRASSRLLIVPENTGSDYYNVSKSNQYLGSLLTETISSGSFFNLASTANSGVNWSYFNGTYKQQIKRWKNTVDARSVSDTGIIEVNVYHPDPEQANQISLAVDNLLLTKNVFYQNASSSIKIEIIDQPIVTSFPVKPNLPINLGVALIFGLVFGLVYINYFPETKKEKNLTAIKIHRATLENLTDINANRPEYIQNQNQADSRDGFSGNIKNIIN